MPELIEIPDPNVYEAYGVYFLKTRHKFVQRLLRTNYPLAHGYRTWYTSFLLMDYLEHNPPSEGCRVMDIGCGWAPVGVYCGRRFRAKVTAMDKDANVIPYVRLMAALNDIKVENLTASFDSISTERLGEEEVIVGSDICFWDDMVDPLYDLVVRAFSAGTRRVIFADPGRQPFFDLAKKSEKQWKSELVRWYSLEPVRRQGEILEINNPALTDS